jgi:predicted RNA-binding protein with PIN domain
MRTILLDGYNVILRSPAFRPGERRNLAAARDKLVNLLTWAVGSEGQAHFVIVFDGADVKGQARRQLTGSKRVELRFSTPPQKADDLIRILVEDLAQNEREVTVVTSDLEVAQHARTHGATIVLSDLFAASLFPERAEAQLKQVLGDAMKQGGASDRSSHGSKAKAGAKAKAKSGTGSPTAEGSDAEAKPAGVSKKQAAEWLRLFEEQQKARRFDDEPER